MATPVNVAFREKTAWPVCLATWPGRGRTRVLFIFGLKMVAGLYRHGMALEAIATELEASRWEAIATPAKEDTV